MRNLLSIILLICALSPACSSGTSEGKKEQTELKIPFGDPFILLYQDTYYAYGTLDADGIAVYTSTDLIHWKVPENLPDGKKCGIG